MSVNKKQLAKSAARFVVGASVSMVSNRFLKTHVPTATIMDEIQLAIGSFAIGGMVSEQSGRWSDGMFDKVEALLTNARTED